MILNHHDIRITGTSPTVAIAIIAVLYILRAKPAGDLAAHALGVYMAHSSYILSTSYSLPPWMESS